MKSLILYILKALVIGLYRLIMFVPYTIFYWFRDCWEDVSDLPIFKIKFCDLKYYLSSQAKLSLQFDILERKDEIIFYYKKDFSLRVIYEYFLDNKKIAKCSFDMFIDIVFDDRKLYEEISSFDAAKNKEKWKHLEPNHHNSNVVIRCRLTSSNPYPSDPVEDNNTTED